MTEQQLKERMEVCYKECFKENPNFKKIIATAVQLGMQYQEEKIKEGINIVFSELHKK